jgi:hypothetical protein
VWEPRPRWARRCSSSSLARGTTSAGDRVVEREAVVGAVVAAEPAESVVADVGAAGGPGLGLAHGEEAVEQGGDVWS